MAETDDLESLQTLHADLLAASESRLNNVERLWVQLESRIEEFRSLLDKRPRNDQSRQSLTTGKIKVQEDEYGINAEFQQNALEVAGALNLDEIDSARLLLESGDDAEALGRSMIECSIIRFHQKRQYLLDCFRIVLQQTAELDPDPDEDLDDGVIPPSAFRNVVKVILNSQGQPGGGSAMIKKCLDEMGNTKVWLQDVADKVNRASVLGPAQTAEIETMEFQRTSLIQQHELLGVIIHYVVLGGHAVPADFDPILENLKRADRYDILLGKLIPTLR
jgi:nuclear pore complex protein Nup205